MPQVFLMLVLKYPTPNSQNSKMSLSAIIGAAHTLPLSTVMSSFDDAAGESNPADSVNESFPSVSHSKLDSEKLISMQFPDIFHIWSPVKKKICTKSTLRNFKAPISERTSFQDHI
ncbi:hypothetical protein TNCV_2708251 [Trichonephila clavipes]|nr:hypothetical protein TNCV_2708251 [Trichonephila clavipes]